MYRDEMQHFYGMGADIMSRSTVQPTTSPHEARELRYIAIAILTYRVHSHIKFDQPMKLGSFGTASENRRLSTCYSDAGAAFDRLGPCSYSFQLTNRVYCRRMCHMQLSRCLRPFCTVRRSTSEVALDIQPALYWNSAL